MLANIARRVLEEPRREELREQATGLNPDNWVTDEEVTAGLEAYESVLASLREVVGRRRRRRRGRGSSPAGDPAGEQGDAQADSDDREADSSSDPGASGPNDSGPPGDPVNND